MNLENALRASIDDVQTRMNPRTGLKGSEPLRPHQRQIRDLCLEHPRFGVFAEPGTGKTYTMLSVLARTGERALVLCPKTIVRAAWIEDARRFTPQLHIVDGTGTPKKRAKAREKFVKDGGALVMNYESFYQDRNAWLALAKADGVQALVLDESTKFKTFGTKITKLIIEFAPHCQRVHPMSGCPTPNSMMELWPQMNVVDPRLLGRYFYAFRDAYFFQPNAEYSWLWKERHGARKEILERVQGHCIFLPIEECVDLPGQHFIRRQVELSRPERRAYDRFISDWVVAFEHGDLVGSSALAQLAKSRQMLAGVAHLKDDFGGDTWAEIGTSKLEALLELLDELGPQPVLIAGAFRFEIERIRDTLAERKKKVAILYGGMSDSARDRVITGFKDGSIQYLVVHPAAMAHGLTFTHCAATVWASQTFSYEEYYQLNARTHRIGQQRKCNYYILYARDTIDERIAEALGAKRDLNLDVAKALTRRV